MNTNSESIAKLQGRIAVNLLEDDEDLLLFIQLASRLKALGNEDAYARLPEILARPEFAGRLEALLKTRCEQGIFDIDEQTGTSLALSMIEAQDFWLFYNYAKEELHFSSELSDKFEEWADSTTAREIDEEVAEVLEDWLDTYPLAEENCLPVIHAPVTEWEYQQLGRVLASLPRKVVSQSWMKVKQDAPVVQPRATKAAPPVWTQFLNQVQACFTPVPSVQFAVCDDGKPAEALLEQQDQLTCVDEEHGFIVRRTLNDCWKLIIEVRTENNEPLQVKMVRLGVLPAVHSATHPNRWTIDLSMYPLEMRQKLLESTELTLQLNSLDSVKIHLQEK